MEDAKIEVLEWVLKEYNEYYQWKCDSLGVIRETPRTAFHTIIESKIKVLKKGSGEM